jgi:hypothetical protein
MSVDVSTWPHADVMRGLEALASTCKSNSQYWQLASAYCGALLTCSSVAQQAFVSEV